MLFTKNIALLLNIIIFLCSTEYVLCGYVKNFQRGVVKQAWIGLQLTKALITTETNIDFMDCVKACSLRKRCSGINYFIGISSCEVLVTGANFVRNSRAIYSPKSKWDSESILALFGVRANFL